MRRGTSRKELRVPSTSGASWAWIGEYLPPIRKSFHRNCKHVPALTCTLEDLLEVTSEAVSIANFRAVVLSVYAIDTWKKERKKERDLIHIWHIFSIDNGGQQSSCDSCKRVCNSTCLRCQLLTQRWCRRSPTGSTTREDRDASRSDSLTLFQKYLSPQTMTLVASNINMFF